MSLDWIRNLVFFIILFFAQVLVLNHIHLFGCATPLLYIYLVMPTRRDAPKWATLLWSFAMGLVIDTFANTPGVAAASMTLIALLQPYLLSLFIQQDAPDDFRPSLKSLGTLKYVFYTLILVVVYCLAFFSLEAFNFYNITQWLACVGGSALLTEVMLLVTDNLRNK